MENMNTDTLIRNATYDIIALTTIWGLIQIKLSIPDTHKVTLKIPFVSKDIITLTADAAFMWFGATTSLLLMRKYY